MILRNKSQDRTFWYDGYIYEKLVASQVAEGNAILKDQVEENSTVLDIGCGAGIFAFTIADKVKHVTGIDFSSKMIKFATKRKIQRNCQNVDFIHYDASRISEVISERFDYAILSLILHETEEETRSKAVIQASKHANRIIISDFSSPFPRSLHAKLLKGQELFVGGISHYRNFRSWMLSGGIDKFIKKNALEIEKTIEWPGKNKGMGKFIFCRKMDR